MDSLRRSFLSCTFAFAVLTAFPIGLYAQAVSGDLVGVVTDPSGAFVSGASIVSRNAATSIETATTANAAGQYRFSNLAVGTYEVRVNAPGFTTSLVKDIDIDLNKTSTANVLLQVGGVSTTVNVTDAPALIDTTTAQIQNTYDERTMDLPLASSGWGALNLSLIESGVASGGGAGVGVGPSVGGQRPRNNNFTVDGVDNNSKVTTGPEVNIPIDAVSEFTLLKNQFSAEYGHSSGGQFNTIVKSGSNIFHGSLYHYLENRNLNAIDIAFQRQGVTQNPRFDQNRIGATAGGPIRRNKWFYFGNFEYTPIGNASTPGGQILAPTSQGYSTLSGIPGLSQTNLGVLKQYLPAAAQPATTIAVNGVAVPFGPLAVVAPNYQNLFAGVASSDYNISDRDQLRGRFVYNRTSSIDTGVSLPQFFLLNPATNYVASLAEYHTFSASLVNEFRLGYNRQNQLFGAGNFHFPGLDVFPNLTFEDIGLQLGPDPQSPQGGVQNLYQGTENLTWIRGAHTLKFGVEMRKYIAPQSFTQQGRGNYDYSTLDLFLRDITPDFAAQRGLGNVMFYGDQIAAYSYAQDTWRLRPNITVDLGLRYEFSTVPYTVRSQTLNSIASVPGVLEFKEPQPQTTAFAPRIGFAYSPGKSGSTSIRAGFGIAYDILCDNINMLALPPELKSMADLTGQGLPNFLQNGGIAPNIPGGSNPTVAQARSNTAYYIPTQIKLPYSVQWNLGVQHVFAKKYTFEIRYLGTRGIHLPMQQQINRVPSVTANMQIPEFMTAPDAATLQALPLNVGNIRAIPNVLPQFSAAGFRNTIAAWTPQGQSTYNGLALEFNRRFSEGLQLRSSYTWSHLLDNSTTEVGSTYLTPRRAENSQQLGPEWASSLLDRRHRLTTMVLYDAPWFKSRSWSMRNLLGNWEFAPSYIYESPEYFTVQSAIDSNLNGDSASDRAMVDPAGIAHTSSDVYGLTRNGDRIGISSPTAQINQVVAWVAMNPNARYIRAGYGVLPNGGRNTEPTRPINNFDLTVLKRFHLSERYHVELAAQAYNLLNHPQFVPGLIDNVNAVVTAYTPGVHNYTTAGNRSFANAEATFSSNPRVVQLFTKFIW